MDRKQARNFKGITVLYSESAKIPTLRVEQLDIGRYLSDILMNTI